MRSLKLRAIDRIAENSQNGVLSFLNSVPRGNATHLFITLYKSYLSARKHMGIIPKIPLCLTMSQIQYKTFWSIKRQGSSQKTRRIARSICLRILLGLRISYSSKVLTKTLIQFHKTKTICASDDSGWVSPAMDLYRFCCRLRIINGGLSARISQ